MGESVKTGVASTARLTKLGYGRRQRCTLLEAGDLLKLGRGWYAWRVHDADTAAAIKQRGRLTCLSALATLGVWMPVEVDSVHVRISHAAPTPVAPGVTIHRVRNCPLGDEPIDTPEIAFRCAVQCLGPLNALIVADSLANKGLLTIDHIDEASARAPRATQRALRFLDARSESGTETIVRYHLRRHRVRVRPQARISGVGPVDLLVGDCLVIECDSKGFHADWSAQSKDRWRDFSAVPAGYLVVRLTYDQVMHRWDETWARLLRMIRLRAHRWSSTGQRLNTSP